jgi:hypothetical protein
MAREDAMVKQWFDFLRIMQSCAAVISLKTQADLAMFYLQRHAEVLIDANLRENFAACVSGQAGINVTDNDFSCTSTFHELLDSAARPLRISVRALFRREAIDNGAIPAETDPAAFESIKTVSLYADDAARSRLTARSAAVMPTLSDGPQARLKKSLAEAETTAGKAIDCIL